MGKNYRGKNSRRRNSGRKPNTGNCKGKSEQIESVECSKTNDPSWYGASGQLLGDAAKISFNNPAGLDVDIQPSDDTGSLLYNQLNHVRFPGIMALDVYTGPGTSTDNSSAVNVAAKNIYSYIRHANSGHANYDAPDLMLYLLAADNAYMWYATLVRLYGTLMLYDANNRFFPEALVTAQGFNFRDLNKHIADLRFIINKFVKQVGSLCVPKDMNIFARHAWLYSNYFYDAATPKSHIYLYRPAGFHLYNETSEAGRLDWTPWDELPYGANSKMKNLNFEAIVRVCDKFADRLMGSEDIGTMGGDILKAYGNENLFAMAMIPEDFTLLPTADDLHVLEQFHNATINGEIVTTENHLDITQDIKSGALLWLPLSNKIGSNEWEGDYIGGKRRILDMPISDPDPESVMEATRMMTMYTNDDNSPLLCGTEFVGMGHIFSMEWTQGGPVVKDHPFSSAMKSDVTTLARLTMFKWHPNVISATPQGPADKPVVVTGIGLWFELNNYTVLDKEALKKMHQVAQLSLWDVPQMGIYKG